MDLTTDVRKGEFDAMDSRDQVRTAADVRGVSSNLLAGAAEQIADWVAEALTDTDVTVEQWRVLSHLHEHRGSTMSALAVGASLNGSTLTRVVDRLTMSALVYRNVDPTDRRRVLVHLSARGRSLIRRLRSRVIAAEAAAAEPLTPDEIAELDRLLRRMTARSYR